MNQQQQLRFSNHSRNSNNKNWLVKRPTSFFEAPYSVCMTIDKLLEALKQFRSSTIQKEKVSKLITALCILELHLQYNLDILKLKSVLAINKRSPLGFVLTLSLKGVIYFNSEEDVWIFCKTSWEEALHCRPVIWRDHWLGTSPVCTRTHMQAICACMHLQYEHACTCTHAHHIHVFTCVFY